MRKRGGFTLTEVIVTIVIVGILAAIAVPMVMGYIEKARMAEAEAGLIAIYINMKANRAETGAYDVKPDGTAIITGEVIREDIVGGNVPGFGAGDLEGKYFRDGDYTLISVNHDSFIAKALGSEMEVSERELCIYETGVIGACPVYGQ